MATKTTPKSTVKSTPKASPTTAAASAVKNVTTQATTKVEAARAAVRERLQQGEEAAVVAAERLGHTLERVIPAPVMPLVVNVQRALVSNVEFAAALARHQAEFATKVAKALIPAA